MVSPYITYHAERLGIPASKAEYRTSDYRMARQRSDAAWVELEASKPLEPMWKSIAAGIGIIVFMVAAYVVAAGLGG